MTVSLRTRRQHSRQGLPASAIYHFFHMPLDESGPYSGRPTYECASGNALTSLRLPLCFQLAEHCSLSIRYRALVLDGLVCVFVCVCVAAPNKHQPVQPQHTARRKHDICGAVNYVKNVNIRLFSSMLSSIRCSNSHRTPAAAASATWMASISSALTRRSLPHPP